MDEQWKLVPTQPTDQMTFIGQSHRYDSVWSIGAIYREMIADTPTQGADARPVAICPREVKRDSDFSVTLVFASCRLASEFERQMIANLKE